MKRKIWMVCVAFTCILVCTLCFSEKTYAFNFPYTLYLEQSESFDSGIIDCTECTVGQETIRIRNYTDHYISNCIVYYTDGVMTRQGGGFSSYGMGSSLYTSSAEEYIASGLQPYVQYVWSLDDKLLYVYSFTYNPLQPPVDPTPEKHDEGEPEQKPDFEPEVVEADETQYTPDVVAIDKTEYEAENDEVVPKETYNFSNYVTARGATAGINKIIDKNPEEKRVSIYSGKPITIDRAFLENIHEKNIDLTYFFMYEGHLYSVTIPANVDATKVLADAPYEGPMYVGKMLGTTRLIK